MPQNHLHFSFHPTGDTEQRMVHVREPGKSTCRQKLIFVCEFIASYGFYVKLLTVGKTLIIAIPLLLSHNFGNTTKHVWLPSQ